MSAPIMWKREPMVGRGPAVWCTPTGELPGTIRRMALPRFRGEVTGICGINKRFHRDEGNQDALAEERNRLAATTAGVEAKNAVLQAD